MLRSSLQYLVANYVVSTYVVCKDVDLGAYSRLKFWSQDNTGIHIRVSASGCEILGSRVGHFTAASLELPGRSTVRALSPVH